MNVTVSMQRYPVNVAAGGVMMLTATGTRFLLKETDGDLNVSLDIGGSMRGLKDGEGYAGRAFNALTITNDGAAAVAGFIVVSDDEYVDHRITGAVTFAPLGATFTNAPKNVTNVSGNLLAANPLRKYLLVQNNHAAGDIYVTLDGTVATAANGVTLKAGGGAIELATVVPSDPINAIGSIAANAAVLVVEG